MMNQTIVTCFLVEINDKINQNAVSNEELKVTQCLQKQKYLRRYKGFVLLFWSWPILDGGWHDWKFWKFEPLSTYECETPPTHAINVQPEIKDGCNL